MMFVRRILLVGVFWLLVSAAGITAVMAAGTRTLNTELVFRSNRAGHSDIFVLDLDRGFMKNLTLDEEADMEPTWSPDGQWLAFASFVDDQWRIVRMSATGRDRRFLTDGSANDNAPSWSPDGTRLAFASDRGDGDAWNIYTMDFNGGNIQQLTDTPYNDITPVWSPDGTQIVFSSNRNDDQIDAYVMNADGSNVRRLTANPEPDGAYAWSRDGTQIAYMSRRTDQADQCSGPRSYTTRCILHGHLYLMTAEGVELQRLTDHATGYWAPSWSPDGGWLAFASRRGHTWSLFRMPVGGGPYERLTDSGGDENYPEWRPGG